MEGTAQRADGRIPLDLGTEPPAGKALLYGVAMEQGARCLPSERSTASAQPRVRAWVVVAAVAVASVFAFPQVLLGPIDGAWGSWRPPDAFAPAGNEVGTTASVGETFLMGVATPTRAVDISSAEAVFRDGSAAAAVEVMACHVGDTAGGFQIGSDRGRDVSRYCRSAEPAAGAHLGRSSVNPKVGDYLFFVVTPLEAGNVAIDGARVHTRGRLIGGEEHIGASLRMRVTGQ
jgi:hypothetical protein